MKNTSRILLISLALLLYTSLFCAQAIASIAQIKGMRMWASQESTRLVIDLSRAAGHRLSRLSNPERIVVDIDNVRLKAPLSQLNFKKGAISDIRSAVKKSNKVRLVLDLKYKINPKSFLLKPNKKYGYRLVIDLEKISNNTRSNVPKIIKSVNSSQKRDLIVAIDAGHGGDDPGASGPRGTKEKHVVLAIARKLRDLVNKKPGMKAVMIRNGDYYVSLRGRTKKARRLNADIFISIHADAFKIPQAHGSSVFILSSRGATSEAAKWLAKKENEADLVGGVSLDDKDDMLVKMLLDLSQTASIEASNTAAAKILRRLSKIGHVHKKSVERAGFAVLKSPDIPSLLIETGFISNPKEERLLKTTSYQKKIANAILHGVDGYFRQYPIPGTVYAKEVVVKKLNAKVISASMKYNKYKHKVVRGDTLSAISKRYQVTISAIKRANKMKTNTLYIGRTLKIPNS